MCEQTSWRVNGKVLFSDDSTGGTPRSPNQAQPKGRRKPVPKLMEDEVNDGIALLQVEESHAM